MGMRVGGTSSAWSSAGTSGVQQRQQNIKDLFAALKADDLGSAQQAFAALAKTSKVDSSSPLGQLGQALQQGDQASAKQLAAALQASKHAQTQAASQQTSSLSMLRGQGGNVNMLV